MILLKYLKQLDLKIIVLNIKLIICRILKLVARLPEYKICLQIMLECVLIILMIHQN